MYHRADISSFTLHSQISIMILRTLFVFSFLVFFGGCATLQAPVYISPEISSTTPTVDLLSFEEVHFTQEFVTKNTHSVPAKIESFSYRVLVRDTEIARGSKTPQMELQKDAEDRFSIPFQINFTELESTIGVFPERETLPYEMRAFVVSYPLSDVSDEGSVTDTLTFNGEFPLLQSPRIVLDTLMLHSFNLAIAELELRVRVVNPNSVPVTMNRADFTIEVDGTTWHRNQINQQVTVPPRADVVLDIPFSMRPRDFGTEVYRNLNMEQEFTYSVMGNAPVMINHPAFTGPHNWDFERSGNQKFDRLQN